MGGNIKNVLLWVGIAALALQDYFKKQPVKTTRQQQFLQTGETSQAFIEGLSEPKKILTYYFGKPTKVIPTKVIKYKRVIYRWKVKEYFLELEKVDDESIISLITNDGQDRSHFLHSPDYLYGIGKIVTYLFFLLENENEDKRYKQLADLAEAGDWELALEIAKGQNLL